MPRTKTCHQRVMLTYSKQVSGPSEDQQVGCIQERNTDFLLTGFLGFNGHVVPLRRLPVQRFSDGYGSVVGVYFESFCVAAPPVD